MTLFCGSDPISIGIDKGDHWDMAEFARHVETCPQCSCGASKIMGLLGSKKSLAKSAASRDNGKKGGRPVEIIGKIYYYDNGQCLAEFRRGGLGDWFVWSPKAGQRLKTYRTKDELVEALEFVRHSYLDDMPSLGQLLLALDGLLPG